MHLISAIDLMCITYGISYGILPHFDALAWISDLWQSSVCVGVIDTPCTSKRNVIHATLEVLGINLLYFLRSYAIKVYMLSM